MSGGALSQAFIEMGYQVLSTDLVDRGYGAGGVLALDDDKTFDGTIVTNPPFSHAQRFIEKALNKVGDDGLAKI